VQNEDRSLSARGGNPNLLVTMDEGKQAGESMEALSDAIETNLWTFDFNLAFDQDFKAVTFWDSHIFGRERNGWQRLFADMMAEKMRGAWDRFPKIWAELPPAWLHLDGDENLPMQLDYDVVWETLRRPWDKDAGFWQES